MTMILRKKSSHLSATTLITHYANIAVFCGSYDDSFVGLYNDQLRSVIKSHGINCDNDGWVWSGPL